MAAAFAAACGSADGDGGAEAPATAYCDPVQSWEDEMVAFEEDVLRLVNEHRERGTSCGGASQGPADPLVMDASLRCAARVHSADMGDRGYFSHESPEGEGPFTRMERAGYAYSSAGENIAAGQASPQSVMDGWMNSPGHCSNIMNPTYQDFGVGAYEPEPGADFPLYWTQTFGSP